LNESRQPSLSVRRWVNKKTRGKGKRKVVSPQGNGVAKEQGFKSEKKKKAGKGII